MAAVVAKVTALVTNFNKKSGWSAEIISKCRVFPRSGTVTGEPANICTGMSLKVFSNQEKKTFSS